MSIKRLPKEARALLRNIDMDRIYTTVGIYADQSFKFNGVKGENLLDHLHYNVDNRPGRAFFIEGICFNSGYFPDSYNAEQVFAAKCTNIKALKDTSPYV